MSSVFIYQAVLPTAPAAVLSVRAVPVRARRGWQLGGELPSRAFRIIIRYALEDGRVLAHRGLLRTALPPDQRLRVAAWQVDGAQVMVTLAPPERARQRRSRRCVTDAFRLPLSFQAWGVTSLKEAAVHLHASACGQGGALQVCGTVTVLLHTPATVLRIRRPFARLLTMPEAEGLAWQVDGGASRLQLRVHPGGRITGEVELAVYYEGRPPGAPSGVESGGILQVRDLQAAVKDVRAEALSAGFVLVQGTVALDVYWVDRGHRSRWTGRDVPFSGVARLGCMEASDQPGVLEPGSLLGVIEAGDRMGASEARGRLEAVAQVTRIQPLPRQGLDWVAMLIRASVTQLRTSDVKLGQRCYRLEEVVGQGAVTVERTVQWADPECLVGTRRQAKVMADLQPPVLWQWLEVSLTGRVLPGDRWKVHGRMMAVPGQAGGWSGDGAGAGESMVAGQGAVLSAGMPSSSDGAFEQAMAMGQRAAVGPGTSAGDDDGLGAAMPVRDREAVRRLSGTWGGELPPGMGQGTVVLPWLVRVGPDGVETRAVLHAVGREGQTVQQILHISRLNLPGPVRWILGLQASGGERARVQVVLAGPAGTWHMDYQLPEPLGAKPPAVLLAYPVEEEGVRQLTLEWTLDGHHGG